MIKFNSNDINDWYDGSDVIKKAYFNGNVAYIRIYAEPLPPPHTPCYAVTSNIATYSDTDFLDVYNQADSSWYKLNNLDQFEKYGVYGTSTGVSETYYEGKLSVDNGYEYVYSGSSWVLLGEVSGSTATLPDVPFTVNYNAKNYDSNTKTLAKTQGQLADIDAVITAGTPTVNDGYLTIDYYTRATISGYQTYFNRDNNNPNLTIISKQNTKGTGSNGCHMFANRDGNYNWMYRPYSNKLTLHGSGEQGNITVTTQPVIESVRIDSNRTITYNNYTDDTSSSYSNFNYGGTNNGSTALFAGYASGDGEWFYGDFYWVYMSQNTLTDAQVQQVIAYNEEGGSSEYPEYYEEKDVPPNHLVFADMKAANLYECPWVGMEATIDGIHYYYTPNYMWELEMPTPTGQTYENVLADYRQLTCCNNYPTPLIVSGTSQTSSGLSWNSSLGYYRIGTNGGYAVLPIEYDNTEHTDTWKITDDSPIYSITFVLQERCLTNLQNALSANTSTYDMYIGQPSGVEVEVPSELAQTYTNLTLELKSGATPLTSISATATSFFRIALINIQKIVNI